MNNFDKIIETIIRLLLLKILNSTENKNCHIIKFLNFCSNFTEKKLIKKHKLPFFVTFSFIKSDINKSGLSMLTCLIK